MGKLGGVLAVGGALAIGVTSTAAFARGVPPIVDEPTPPDPIVTLERLPVPPDPLPTAPPPAPPPAKLPPSLAWSLRPPAVATVVRLDTAIGLYGDGAAFAPTLTGMAKLAEGFGVMARVGTAHIVTDVQQSAFANLVLGVYATPKVADGWRVTLFFGGTVPVGTGGGTVEPSVVNPSPSSKDVPLGYKALGGAASARGAMDNMLFAVNYAAFAAGAGVTYAAANGFTVQMEATVFGLGRISGDAYEPDESKVNFTTGVHVGHTIGPVNLSFEVRYQCWVSTPTAVAKDDTKRDNLTAGIGVRTRFVLVPDRLAVRPGIAYFEPLDNPMAGAGYHFFVLDLPFVF